MGHYVTKQPGLRFYQGDEIVTLPAGAKVPNAESLPNFSAMMRIGQLAFVNEGGGDALEPFEKQAEKQADKPKAPKPKNKRA